MDMRDPLSASPFVFERLDDDEWEELTFLVAHREDDRVVRLRAPDGGLDTVLPSRERPGEAERGWQAKRYGRDIHWAKCEESLDRAVRIWHARHVTFVFPKDLNQAEHQRFHEKLGGRHAGVTVDYWGAGAISSQLLADDRGERIAKRFFGVRDPIALMERAQRAGGPLSGGEDVLEREAAVHEFLQSADPHFDWAVQMLVSDESDPPARPGAIMRLCFSRGDQKLVADAIPRSQTSATQYGPAVRIIADESPEGDEVRRLLSDLLTGGGRLRLREGFRVAFDRIPQPFREMVRSPFKGEVFIKSVDTPAPYYASLQVVSNLGDAHLDVDLLPIAQPDEWDLALHGGRGGFELTVMMRWSVNDGLGELTYNFFYRPDRHRYPLADQAKAVRMMVALHGHGELRIRDRAGHRPEFQRSLQRRFLHPDIADWARLLIALAEIERLSGRPAPAIPDEFDRADIDLLEKAVRALRVGGEIHRMRTARFSGRSEIVETMRRVGTDLVVRGTATVGALGEEIPFAEYEARLPPMLYSQAERHAGTEDMWDVTMVPVAAEEIEVFHQFRPLGSRNGDA